MNIAEYILCARDDNKHLKYNVEKGTQSFFY